MKIDLRALALAITFIAVCAPHAVFAEAAVATPVDGSYAQFRQLAEPLRLIDTLGAQVVKMTMTNEDAQRHSEKWRQALIAAFERRLSGKRGAIIDAVMSEAFKSFTPAEVQRLSVICQSPAVAHFESRKIEAMRRGESTTGLVRAESGFREMSLEDLRLLSRINTAIAQGLPLSTPIWRPLLRDAWHDADAVGQ